MSTDVGPIDPARVARMRKDIAGDALEQDDALALMAAHDCLAETVVAMQARIDGLMNESSERDAEDAASKVESHRLRVLLAASWGLAS